MKFLHLVQLRHLFVLVAAALSLPAFAQEKAVELPWHLVCVDSPALNSWRWATPETFEEALRNSVLHKEMDPDSEGMQWRLAHWVEVHHPPHQRDMVAIPGSFEFRATAHLVVVREFWTYQVNEKGRRQKKEWVRRTVAHITAGGPNEKDPMIRASAHLTPKSKFEIEPTLFDASAHSNGQGAHPITWKGKTLGWVAVSWRALGPKLFTHPRWLEAGKDDAAAKLTTNYSQTQGDGNYGLQWLFAVRRTADGVERDLGSPTNRPDFKIPPPDETK